MEQLSRRRFSNAVIYGLNALIGAAMAVPSALYLLWPKKALASTEWIRVGPLEEIPLNAPSEVAYDEVRWDGWKQVAQRATTWVVKKSDAEATALHPRCTHLGCAYHWEEGRSEFACPCHASAFRADGSVIEGPAPRALDRFETKVENGVLFVGRVLPGKEV
jgi:menaquinol-cytochrome c reductase iron-sulfur subunit